MGNLLCDPGRELPRASQTTQVSSTLSWDEIQNLSQLPWLPTIFCRSEAQTVNAGRGMDGKSSPAWPGLAQEGCGELIEWALDGHREAETWLALLLVRQTRRAFCIQGPQQGGFFCWTSPPSTCRTNSRSPFRSLGTLLACCLLHVPFKPLSTVGWVDSWDCSREATMEIHVCSLSAPHTEHSVTQDTPPR